MAKRDKTKSEANAESTDRKETKKQAAAGKAAKKSAGKTGNPHPMLGLLKQTGLGLLGGILGVMLCTFGAYQLFMIQAGKQTERLLATTHANAYIRQVEQQSELLRASVQQLSHHPQVLAALRNPAEADLNRLATQLTRQTPFAVRVLILPLNQAKRDDEANPPISFAPLDQIRRGEKRETALPEIHRVNNQTFLNVVAPIVFGPQETVLGTVFVNFDFTTISRQLAALDNQQGYLEIVQQFAGSSPMVFHSTGNSGLKMGDGIKQSGQYPHWEAYFYAGPGANPAAQNATTLMIYALVAVIVVIAFNAIALFLLHRALTLDVTRLTRAFNALTAREKHSATFTLSIFTSLSHTIDRLFHEYDAQIRHQAIKQKGAGKSGSEVEVALDIAFSDHSGNDLDVDLSDDDANLMGGATAQAVDSPLNLAKPSEDILDLDVLEMADLDPDEDQGLSELNLPDEIFRAYDIRGIVDKTLTKSIAQSIGMAIGSEVRDHGETAIILARDGRESSAGLASSLLNGLIASGLKVIDIGMVPTPMLYFATKTLGVSSGVVVTGSHNPPQYNGFKIVIDGEALALERIKGLKERLERGRLVQGRGSHENYDIIREYSDRIVNDVVLAKPMRIIVDCGNGVTGPFAPSILEDLGCSVTTLYGEIDGNFPNHHPDPSNPANLQALIDAVQSNNAELGLAFDGDGDRLGVVLPSGEIAWPDRLLMLYARDLLARNPGADILYDVKCSRDVAELVSSLGGRAIMCATGHSLMKAKMKETGAVVGGELSGHIFFNERWYGFDDAIYAAARLLEILSMEPYDATQVFAEFPTKHNTPELHVAIPEARKFATAERFVREAQFPDGNSSELDGLRVDFADGWGLLRASNTTPALTLRFEAETEEGLHRIKQQFREQLLAIDPQLDVSF